ncbi:HAMP domain-containing protein [Nostoc sp. FACHB-152]|uniref:ATP-binding protein n=1 Tax=unclassified Nostoc TaxID=2593658 RepID=UPI001687C0FD|nr:MULTISPECIES: ATP-binding protein [unclassified Nostoc]MBD2449372.1 HAMP domain-containing protein [Nostoc sp. FACHB-152]MBD2470713.1 HAMP domain-containing protein [Nostoc sp. FACHB-145]
MKISTKFFTASVITLGCIIAILVGNTLLIQGIKQNIRDKSQRSTETVKVALEAENALKSQIIELKDVLLLKTDTTPIEKSSTQFLQSLDRLENLLQNTPEIAVIRRRHQFLRQMTNQLTQSNSSTIYLADSQQYFRAINSFNRDIELFLSQIVERAYQQNILVEEELKNLHQVQRIISFGVVGVIIILFLCKFLLIWQPTIQSLYKLQVGTAEIANENFNYRLNITTGDEMEDLAKAFNYMALKLNESRETLLKNTELTAMNQRLEIEVAERKQAELELQQTFIELKNTQAQLIQTEKMSSLGQLVAGVAHEINNPVNFIYGNITHAYEYSQELLELISLYQEHFPEPGDNIQEKISDMELEFVLDDLPKTLISMKMGAQRIREIVLSLRNFSRLDEADMKEVDIHEGIESTLLILQNRLKAKPEHPAIQVIKKYGNLPVVECYAGQLNQVFMNIINNAIDALDSYYRDRRPQEIANNPAQIIITTTVSNNNLVLLEIADNGPGMTEETKQKLFDPFFTTKPVGQGTGLGLSISYQIIQKHSGVLRCSSELGQGTKFSIEIPLSQQQQKTAQMQAAIA